MAVVGVNCFGDSEIQAFIKSKNKFGKCDFSESENVEIAEIEELLDFFDELAVKILRHVINLLGLDIDVYSKMNFIPEIMENIGYWNTFKEEIKWKKGIQLIFINWRIWVGTASLRVKLS